MEPKSDTHGEKHRVTGEANEVFQSMAFVYLNHKKNLKMKKKVARFGCGMF